MFKKILKQIKKYSMSSSHRRRQHYSHGSSEHRRHYYHGSSSRKRGHYFHGSSSGRHKHSPFSGSHRYKGKKYRSSSFF